jgi:hypothetical protein
MSNDESEESVTESRELARDALRTKPSKRWWENSLWIWGVQVGMLGIWALLAGYIVLWLDAHNDNRYLQKTDYQRDTLVFMDRYRENRESDRKEREVLRSSFSQDNGNLSRQLERFQQQIDTMSSDIKSLLRGQK